MLERKCLIRSFGTTIKCVSRVSSLWHSQAEVAADWLRTSNFLILMETNARIPLPRTLSLSLRHLQMIIIKRRPVVRRFPLRGPCAFRNRVSQRKHEQVPTPPVGGCSHSRTASHPAQYLSTLGLDIVEALNLTLSRSPSSQNTRLDSASKNQFPMRIGVYASSDFQHRYIPRRLGAQEVA